MAKKAMRRRLSDDIRASVREALDHAAGKRTKAVVHKVMPPATDSRTPRALAKSDIAT
jgi:hypothetical protein